VAAEAAMVEEFVRPQAAALQERGREPEPGWEPEPVPEREPVPRRNREAVPELVLAPEPVQGPRCSQHSCLTAWFRGRDSGKPTICFSCKPPGK